MKKPLWGPESQCTGPGKIHAMVTVGAKGQIVIPKEARDLVGVKPWDSMMVITKEDYIVALIPAGNFEKFVKMLREEMDPEEKKRTAEVIEKGMQEVLNSPSK